MGTASFKSRDRLARAPGEGAVVEALATSESDLPYRQMNKTFLTLFVFSAFAGIASAQLPIGAGLKIGTSLNDAYSRASSILTGGAVTAYSADDSKLIIGPMVELRLPFHIAIEADALYRNVNFRRAIIGTPLPGSTVLTSASIDSSAWEFPILFKYKFGGIPLLKPYLGAGFTFKRVTGDDVIELTHRGSTGVVLEGGVEIKLLLLRISPEIRYSGYTTRSFEAPANLLKTNKNELAFLVGFSF